MATDSLVKLKLSIWRDFAPRNALILWPANSKDQQIISGDSDIQQEVFTWQMREDPFDGVSEEGDRRKLRELLLERFEPSLAPADRRIDRLNDFLTEVDRVLEAGGAEWTNSLYPPFDDEDAPYRLNPILALKNQIEWLAGVFGGLPGLSVSIR